MHLPPVNLATRSTAPAECRPVEDRGSGVRLGAVALAALLFGAPPVAAAQPAGKAPVVGYLFAGPRDCKLTSRDDAFYEGLRDAGYVRGQNITVDRRCYLSSGEARTALSEFVARKVDVIVVGVPDVALAARAATRDIPIVCTSCGDPLANGLAASLARPGGNVTGLASQSAELVGKRVDLLKEAMPGISRVAALVNPDNPGTPATVIALEAAARASGMQIQRVDFRGVGDLESAFRSAATGRARAVLVQDDPYTFAGRTQIADLGFRHGLPVAAGISDIAEAGGLMAYGPSRLDLYRRAAAFVEKILKGAKAGDLPFEQPTKYDLVINLRTARALGVTIAPSIVLRADRVIE